MGAKAIGEEAADIHLSAKFHQTWLKMLPQMRKSFIQNFGPIRPPFGDIETFLGGKKEMRYWAGRCSKNFALLNDKLMLPGRCIHDMG